MKRASSILILLALLASTAGATTVITRAGKGSALTWGEMDTNLTGLATAVDTKAPIASPTFTSGITTPAITLGATPLTATGTELNYVHGVTGPIQAQLDNLAMKRGYVYINWNSWVVDVNDYTIIGDFGGTLTLTLPNVATSVGRILHIKTLGGLIVSSATNIKTLNGVSLTSTIVTSTAGKFATLQSDGLYWQTIAAN